MSIARYGLVSVTIPILLSLLVVTFVAVQPAYGQAEVVRVELRNTWSDTGATECLPPDLSGTVTGTAVVVAQLVFTDQGVHEHGTDVSEDYRVDFPDGSYAFGTAVGHFTLNV